MSAIAISGIAFASIFGAAVLSMLLRSILPDRYLSAGSKEVVGLGTGLIATMSAVLLGLLISSTRTSYEEKRNQVIRMTADIIVDITTTGATLAANGLKVLEDGVILRSEANLVASRMAAWPQETKKTCERLLARLKISTPAV